MDGTTAGDRQPLLGGNGQQPKESRHATARRRTKRFLSSKAGHYAVLALVSLDVAAIFVDFVIQLLTCEGGLSEADGGLGVDVLDVVTQVFSYLFMAELVASVWSFGWRLYVFAFALLSPLCFPLSPPCG